MSIGLGEDSKSGTSKSPGPFKWPNLPVGDPLQGLVFKLWQALASLQVSHPQWHKCVRLVCRRLTSGISKPISSFKCLTKPMGILQAHYFVYSSVSVWLLSNVFWPWQEVGYFLCFLISHQSYCIKTNQSFLSHNSPITSHSIYEKNMYTALSTFQSSKIGALFNFILF